MDQTRPTRRALRRIGDENMVRASSSAANATAAAATVKQALASVAGSTVAMATASASVLVAEKTFIGPGSTDSSVSTRKDSSATSGSAGAGSTTGSKRAALSTLTNTALSTGPAIAIAPVKPVSGSTRPKLSVFQQQQQQHSRTLPVTHAPAKSKHNNKSRALKHSSGTTSAAKSSKKSKHTVWVDETIDTTILSTASLVETKPYSRIPKRVETTSFVESSNSSNVYSCDDEEEEREEDDDEGEGEELNSNTSKASINHRIDHKHHSDNNDEENEMEEEEQEEDEDDKNIVTRVQYKQSKYGDEDDAEEDDEDHETENVENSLGSYSSAGTRAYYRPSSTYSDDTEIEEEANDNDEEHQVNALPSQQQHHHHQISPSSATTLDEPVGEDDDDDDESIHIYHDSVDYHHSREGYDNNTAPPTSVAFAAPSARRFGSQQLSSSDLVITSVSATIAAPVPLSAAVAGTASSAPTPQAVQEEPISSYTIPHYCVSLERKPCRTNPNYVFPLWTSMAHEKMMQATEVVSNTPGIFDEADDDTYDISMVAEYSNDIFRHLRTLEFKYLPDPTYMDRQLDMDWCKRGILVDWLVRVHDHCNLLPETLFLTINYMDRFLTMKAVGQSRLQLVGVVALFLAAKHEEITCPSVQEIAYLVENEYSIEDILRAERYMINILDFNMGWPGPMSFLRRSSKADDYDSDTRTLAKYLLELTIMDERFVAAVPSWLAAAAHYLSRLILSRGPWSDIHVYFSGYTEEQLKPAVKLMIECCRDPIAHHKSIFQKYTEERFKWVSLHVAEWMNKNSH